MMVAVVEWMEAAAKDLVVVARGMVGQAKVIKVVVREAGRW